MSAPIIRRTRRTARKRNNAALFIGLGFASVLSVMSLLTYRERIVSTGTSLYKQLGDSGDAVIGGAGLVAFLFVLGFVLLLLYFLPTIIAFERRHQNAPAIAALNFLLGWSVWGWVAALVWSLTEVRSRDNFHYHYH
jgi:hypothetical protein